jgi:hypothetical protein
MQAAVLEALMDGKQVSTGDICAALRLTLDVIIPAAGADALEALMDGKQVRRESCCDGVCRLCSGRGTEQLQSVTKSAASPAA